MNMYQVLRKVSSIAALSAVSFLPVNAQITNWEMAAKMGKGINMGNTLEAAYEGAWAMAAQEYFFDDYKAAGFTNVRIPINWGNRADGAGNIEASFMNRVEEVVDWSLERGLVTIINIHHENWLIGDYWGNKDRAVRIWEQIADRFKDKDENLVFELFNEPRDNMGAAEVTDFNYTIHPLVRATNPTRTLIVGAGAWGHWSDLFYVDYPTDQYTMVQFHYYDPHSFTHVSQYDFWDHDQIWNDIGQIAPYIKDKYNIPLYCGEFGVMHSNDEYPKDWAAVLAYYDNVTEVLNHYGIPFSVWDDQGWFGVYDRGGRQYNEILGEINCPSGEVPDPIVRCENPFDLPGTIEAEDFCSMDGIRTEASSEGGLNVGYIESDDWLKYTVNVPSAGTYTISYRVASMSGGGSFRLESGDGSTDFGSVEVPLTGDWQEWTNVSHEVDFVGGEQEIAIVATGGGWNLNYFEVSTLVTTNSYASQQQQNFSLSPNPAAEQVNIHGSATAHLMYQLMAVNGQLIQQETLGLGASINLSSVQPGIYFVQIGNVRQKLVKL